MITAGGGAVLMAPGRREWIVLKKFADAISRIELLPDINCALALVQLKEFPKNEISRKEIFSLYQRACMSGKHKMFSRKNNPGELETVQTNDDAHTDGRTSLNLDYTSTMCAFPLVLSSAFKDVKHYAVRKEIEVLQGYEDSVIALKQEELGETCIRANSLFLRCALFPLYPRLTHSHIEKIVKVLSTLP